MVAVDVKCTCPICGKMFVLTRRFHTKEEADEWINWRISNFGETTWITCFKCRRKQEAEQAAIDNKRAGLPALIGSPQQIAWAECIRSKMWSNFIKDSEEYYRREKTKEEQDKISLLLTMCFNVFHDIKEANTYIGSRCSNWKNFCQENNQKNIF